MDSFWKLAFLALLTTSISGQRLQGSVFHWQAGGNSDLVHVESLQPINTTLRSLVSVELLSGIREKLGIDLGHNALALACPALLRHNSSKKTLLHLNVRYRSVQNGIGLFDIETWRHPCIRRGVYECSSLLYTQLIDSETFAPLGPGHRLPVPETLGMPPGFATGPEDARSLRVGDLGTVIAFNYPAMKTDRTTMLWGGVDPGRHMYYFMAAEHETKNRIVLIKPRIVRTDLKSHSKTSIPLRQFEKNWSPLDIDGELHFVRSFAPLQIIRCPTNLHHNEASTFIETDCELLHASDESGASRGNFHIGSLRGGSPFVEWPTHLTDHGASRGHRYFVCVAHSTTAFSGRHFYRMHVVVLQVAPVFSLVFISDPVLLPTNRPSSHQEKESGLQSKYDWWPLRDKWLHLVEFASSLELEDHGDTWVVAFHINDQVPLVARIEGLRSLVGQALDIHEDRASNCDSSGGVGHAPMESSADSSAICWNLGSSRLDEQALVEKAVQMGVGRYIGRLGLEVQLHSQSADVIMKFRVKGKDYEFGLWKGAPVNDIADLICRDHSSSLDGAGCAEIRERVNALTGRLDAGASVDEWLSLPQSLDF